MSNIDPSDFVHGIFSPSLDSLYEDIFLSTHLLEGGGESVHPRDIPPVAAGAVGTGTLRLDGFKCKRTEAVVRIAFGTNSIAIAAGATVLRYGLYERSVDKLSYNLVASTPHDATLGAVANTWYPKAVSVPYIKIRGREYLVAFLVVTGGSAGNLMGPGTYAAPTYATAFQQTGTIRCATLAAQADLPASFLVSALSISVNPMCCIVGP